MPAPHGPLILTLMLDGSTTSFLTSLRAAHFPPHLNRLGAHLTLFHAIPAHRETEVRELLGRACQRDGWDIFVGGPGKPRRMGKGGVMLGVRERPSAMVQGFRAELLDALVKTTRDERGQLTDQDKRSMGRPHVTVLNKADREEEIDKCMKEVAEAFEKMKGEHEKHGQWKGRAVGVAMFEYLRGGSWRPMHEWIFQDSLSQEMHQEKPAAEQNRRAPHS